MKYFDWDDRNLKDDLAPEFEFTRRYQALADAPRAAREAACLAVSLPAMALPIEPGDWFFGRRRYRPIGIAPMYWNNETDGLDHIAYYADLDRLERVAARPTLTGGQREALEALIAFWRTENVNSLVRARFDPAMRREMPSDYWEVDSGAIFGLYRYAGAQLDYDKLVRLGLPGLRGEVEARLAAGADGEGEAFLRGLLSVLDTLDGLLARYQAEAEALPDSRAARLMREAARDLRVSPPRSYHQAVQLVWLYSAFSGTVDFGRADVFLGDWFCHDLDAGVLSPEQAMEITLAFYRMMQQVHNRDCRMILGGLGRRNPGQADRFAIFAMEASAVHGELQPQVSLRMYPGMDPRVRDAGMALLARGMTYPILYNDPASVEAVMDGMGVSRAEAEQYGFFGCGEYVITACSMGTPNDIINLAKALEVTLHNGVDPATGRPHGLALGEFRSFERFEDLYAAYRKQVEYFAGISAAHQRLVYDVANEKASMLMMSLLNDDCVARARAAADGGIRYLAGTYETYGNITAADSLLAIRRAVYEERRFTQDQLLRLLDTDFEGHEDDRQYLLGLPKFGNDDPEADAMAHEVNAHICQTTRALAAPNGLASYNVVIINNSANTILGRRTLASADGRHAWAPLSNGNNPSPGMDRCGLTCMLHSLASTDMRLTAGTAQNLRLGRKLFLGRRDLVDALIDAAFDLGLLSLNITVADQEELEDAMIHPEAHAGLFVRVGGFSARFIDLEPDVQLDVLRRTTY